MEAIMRILVSVMALAVALMWPAAGDAQSKQTKSAKNTKNSTQQSHMQRHAKVRVTRPSTEKPCAARTWAGCQGWDPDPNVRSMIQMDAGRDDR
ncbi:MAG TPA: hypothetical protein VGO84_06395 [Burkholderiales bacterium]|jgi:hypothetical protein|nr:hypothetical protein [Burkholderiales bacterium]